MPHLNILFWLYSCQILVSSYFQLIAIYRSSVFYWAYYTAGKPINKVLVNFLLKVLRNWMICSENIELTFVETFKHIASLQTKLQSYFFCKWKYLVCLFKNYCLLFLFNIPWAYSNYRIVQNPKILVSPQTSFLMLQT